MSKKLKEKQLGHWCEFCPMKTTRATWRNAHFNSFACDDHKSRLDEIERKSDGEYTEADYATWLKV